VNAYRERVRPRPTWLYVIGWILFSLGMMSVAVCGLMVMGDPAPRETGYESPAWAGPTIIAVVAVVFVGVVCVAVSVGIGYADRRARQRRSWMSTS